MKRYCQTLPTLFVFFTEEIDVPNLDLSSEYTSSQSA